VTYDRLTDALIIEGSELVWFARRRFAVAYDEEDACLGSPVTPARRQQLTGQASTCPLSLTERRGALTFCIRCEADAASGYTLSLIRSVTGRAGHPAPDTVRQIRGEAYLAGYLYFRETGKVPALRILYDLPDSPAPDVTEETPTAEQLRAFFCRLLDAASVHAAPEIDRVTRRLPALERAVFPYPAVREGQRELMELTYSVLRRGERLFACAPTGTGKTMSVLYPAVRALGAGICDKVFYLTPKGTAAAAAADAVCKLCETGAPVRAVILSAKEKICPAGRMCRQGAACGFSPNAPSREDGAARELLAAGIPAVGEDALLSAARKWQVCPYELSLRYSTYCDVIIGDYNYLFDPRVALHRYFDRHGSYAFLIDEAHNLVERARAAYSAALTLEQIDRALKITAGLAEPYHALETLRAVFLSRMQTALHGETRTDQKGVRRAFASGTELPGDVYHNACIVSYALAAVPLHTLPRERAEELRSLRRDWQTTTDRFGLFGEGMCVFYEREGSRLSLRTVCLDPSRILSDRLSRGNSAVFFSATLTPADYYRDVLGGDRNSRTVEVESPFDRDNLCVAVMDKISTRYLQREDTVRAVVRAILTAVRAKPGNYLVFCPSYSYMMQLSDAFHRAIPNLPILVQERQMDAAARAAFLAAFDAHPKQALVGFCVMGGIYSEGVDLVGKRLIGAVIVGVGLPGLSNEREAVRAYFDERRESGREYAYVYPGMNRVLQAAGRVIRTESDRGIVLLIDDRFGSPEYRHLIPEHWRGLHYVGDQTSLTRLLTAFWSGEKPK